METKYDLTLISVSALNANPMVVIDHRWKMALTAFLESTSSTSITGKGVPAEESPMETVGSTEPIVNRLVLTFDKDAKKNAELFKLLMQVESKVSLAILLAPVDGITETSPALFLDNSKLGEYSTAEIEGVEYGTLDISFDEINASDLVQRFATNVALYHTPKTKPD